MREQFIGKTFWITLAGAALAHLVAFFALHTPVEDWIVVMIAAAVLMLSLWRLEVGLMIAFAELFVGSHGHLFSYDWFSVRMGIFVAVLGAWLLMLLSNQIKVSLKDARLYPWYLLGFAVLLGVVVALAQGNIKADIFNDANAYLYAGYLLPMLTIKWNSIKKRQLLQVLAAGVVFIVLETLGLFYAFTHAGEDLERLLYTFWRDARLAELTRVDGNIFRVFLQSQFTVVVGLTILTSALYLIWERANRWFLGIGLIGAWATIIISLSRSFWVGLIAGLFVAIAIILFGFKLKYSRLLCRSTYLLMMAVGGIGLLFGILIFPIPQSMGAGGLGSLLADRATEFNEAAARSRWNLVEPMMGQIGQSPILGQGFGTVVEYQSDDPRVQNLHGGIATTYSFEWGWLDVWLKMGFLGLLAYSWIFVFYIMALWNAARDEESHWLGLGLLCALVALFATHIFSPYLNHPIGLGFLIFLLPFLKISQPKLSLEALRQKMKTKPAVQTTPAMTAKVND